MGPGFDSRRTHSQYNFFFSLIHTFFFFVRGKKEVPTFKREVEVETNGGALDLKGGGIELSW